MNGIDYISFVVRIAAFLTTYYFMIDYLFMCNIDTRLGSTIAIIGIVAISIAYYPLRGRHLKLCSECNNRHGNKK
jgi:hypothetical protein